MRYISRRLCESRRLNESHFKFGSLDFTIQESGDLDHHTFYSTKENKSSSNY